MNKNICDNFIVGINIIFNWMEKRWITKNEGYLSSETTRKANKNPYFKHHGITASWWFYWNSIWIMSMSSDWTAPYSMYDCTSSAKAGGHSEIKMKIKVENETIWSVSNYEISNIHCGPRVVRMGIERERNSDVGWVLTHLSNRVIFISFPFCTFREWFCIFFL